MQAFESDDRLAAIATFDAIYGVGPTKAREWWVASAAGWDGLCVGRGPRVDGEMVGLIGGVFPPIPLPCLARVNAGYHALDDLKAAVKGGAVVLSDTQVGRVCNVCFGCACLRACVCVCVSLLAADHSLHPVSLGDQLIGLKYYDDLQTKMTRDRLMVRETSSLGQMGLLGDGVLCSIWWC